MPRLCRSKTECVTQWVRPRHRGPNRGRSRHAHHACTLQLTSSLLSLDVLSLSLCIALYTRLPYNLTPSPYTHTGRCSSHGCLLHRYFGHISHPHPLEPPHPFSAALPTPLPPCHVPLTHRALCAVVSMVRQNACHACSALRSPYSLCCDASSSSCHRRHGQGCDGSIHRLQ